MSRISSGIAISGSSLTSWRIKAIGKSGARSSGPTGSPVPGCSTGCGGFGMSATTLYQRRGSCDSASRNFVCSTPPTLIGAALCWQGRSAFGLRRDPIERLLDGRPPLVRHQLSPPAPHAPEVGAELSRPGELRFTVFRLELERLREVWHRPAHEPELHELRTLEADRLERRRDRLTHRRVVRGQHHVGAAYPHLQLVPECTRRPAQVGR